MEHNIIESSAVGIEVCKALGLDPKRVQRIVLDFDTRNYREPLVVYVEMIADERFLSIKWEFGEGIKIKYSDSDKQQEQ